MSLAQLSRLLPLPESDLQQLLDYASTLSKQAAADHFNGILGESSQSIEFISSFNSRRKNVATKQTPEPAAAESEPSHVPKPVRGPKKKKAPLHTPPPRQVQDTYAAQGHVYNKKQEDDYITKRPASTFALSTQPAAIQAPVRAPPSAAGPLISDLPKASKSTTNSKNSSRNASPAPRASTKINITGGTSMKGASKVLDELDSAIRSLEIQTNPSLQDNEKRKCNCIATRHPLLAAAPNCTNCGKVICVKEGLGPCTFCGTPLLSPTEIQGMIRELREERGREKMNIDRAAHKRADVSKTPAPFANRNGAAIEALTNPSAADKALLHRDRLLGFQAQNAKRTTVHDEAADFDTPEAGQSMWSTPQERALQLKRQQKVLREQEWNAKPEWEKRRQVFSIDLVGGKAVKKMGYVTKEEVFGKDDEEIVETPDDGYNQPLAESSGNKSKSNFSQNPLMGSLIRPVYNAGKGKEKAATDGEERKRKTWRRVQDDMEDNEAVILDGGIYSGDTSERRLGEEEHAVGS